MPMKKTANDEFVFDKPELTIVTFDSIFKAAQHKTVLQLRNLHDIIYNNISADLVKFTTDIKKLLLHHLILEVLQRMSQIKTRNKILLLQPSYKEIMLDDWKHAHKRNEVIKFVSKCFTKIRKHLPYAIHVSKYAIDLSKHEAGEVQDLVHRLSKQMEQHLLQSPTTRKFKEFTQKNGLVFLDKFCQSEEFKKLLY